MPKLRSEHPWTVAVLDHLADGEWHDYIETVLVACEHVPEEQAFEKAEYYRQYHYSKSGRDIPERRYGDRGDSVKTGQRFIVSKCLQSLVSRGIVHVAYDENDNRKRKRPVAVRLAGNETN